jgi:NAD(P)-dependent dehydrogenase (short-subunit alcohol dehydrogenase family)
MRPTAQLSYFAANFGDLASVARLVRDIRGATDRIDLLINNAARPGPPIRIVTDARQWDYLPDQLPDSRR